MIQIQADFAVNVSGVDVAVLIGNVQVAVAAGDADVPVTRGSDHRSLAGKRNVQILGHPMIAGALVIRVQSYHASADGELRFGAGVPFIGFALTFGTDAFMDDYANLIVVGCDDVHSAASVGNAEAGSGGESLSQLVVKVIF